MREYGLIGYPLGHSFSPAYFRNKFLQEKIDARYDAFPLEHVEEFPRLIAAHPHLRGLNVTIPHKESIIPYLDALHPDAEAMGAVNCIAFHNGKSTGYNTDWIGFRDSLQPLLHAHHTQALVLGTGGASKAVTYALRQLGIEYTVVSRRTTGASISYEDVTEESVRTHMLIINTTPLGMHPREEEAPPLPYAAVTAQHLLYDLVYNPAQTRFLSEGAKRGAAIKNGAEMLHIQADESWRIWQSDYSPTV